MKSKWTLTISFLLAILVLTSTAIPVFAQSQSVEVTDRAVPEPVIKTLQLRSPGVVYAGQEMTLGVCERWSGNPVGGAEVWAFSFERGKTLEQQISELDAEKAVAFDYQSLVSGSDAIRLGITGNDGRLKCKIADPGEYILVAFKNGYYPGFARLTVKEIVPSLAIKVPSIVRVHDAVTMTVFERHSGQAVDGAGVWAFTNSDADTLINELGSAQAFNAFDSINQDYESLFNLHGEYLGRTHDGGQLTHVFHQTGKYILVTWKPGYIPGFARLTVRDVTKSLIIRAPKTAGTGQPVTMTVYEKTNYAVTETAPIPVEGAGIWAVLSGNLEQLKRDISEIGAEPLTNDYEMLFNRCGEFLGRTNENGQLTHTFTTPGRYVLITWKPGYYPGFTSISIIPTIKDLIIRAPKEAYVNQSVTIGVYEKSPLLHPQAGIISESAKPDVLLVPQQNSAISIPDKAATIPSTAQPLPTAPHEKAPDVTVSSVLIPVSEAGVWAFTRDSAAIIQKELDAIASANTLSTEYDYESLLRSHGEFLGWTNENGQLRHAFTKADKYLLVTWKKGYRPGFSSIAVKPVPKALGIRAPWFAWTHQDVTMTVYDRYTHDPVEGAHMWAFSWNQIDSLREAMPDISAGFDIQSNDINPEVMMNNFGGIYLGKTGNNGEIVHAFSNPGAYLLITFKDSYWPGFGGIVIRDLIQPEPNDILTKPFE